MRWEARILWAGNSNHADRELPRLCVKLQSGIRYTCARAVQLFSLFVWLTFPGRVHMTCTLSVEALAVARRTAVPTMKSRTFSAAAASTAHATASPKDDILQIRRLS